MSVEEALLFNHVKQVKEMEKMSTEALSATEIVHKTAYWGSIRVGTPPQEFKAKGSLVLAG